ncbi:uncharacterized protein MAM_01352 [Metarhizium album ARSEF 1941]|uniref:Uncharacterized protein n=1 Tax=Metarhizium album (strain ARSEF 1941) TaxID=1081103 RepID=A0A0B2X2P8_METAS|nr:uncharacterized protein MAM_01352 [Metarhizium album ARSEF 1941]KHO00574.1 hypothetical protein MAM_01352 [Metarhizium album ARSEF 1941]
MQPTGIIALYSDEEKADFTAFEEKGLKPSEIPLAVMRVEGNSPTPDQHSVFNAFFADNAHGLIMASPHPDTLSTIAVLYLGLMIENGVVKEVTGNVTYNVLESILPAVQRSDQELRKAIRAVLEEAGPGLLQKPGNATSPSPHGQAAETKAPLAQGPGEAAATDAPGPGDKKVAAARRQAPGEWQASGQPKAEDDRQGAMRP